MGARLHAFLFGEYRPSVAHFRVCGAHCSPAGTNLWTYEPVIYVLASILL